MAMASANITPYTRTLALGIVAGMRSFLAPALLRTDAAKNDRTKAIDTPGEILSSPHIATALQVLAVGELIGDKLPRTPSRLAPLPLLARVGSGALVGYAIFGADKRTNPRWRIGGAILGGAAALAGAYGGYHLRKLVSEKTGLPDAVIAFGEDALALGIGKSVLG